MAQAGDTRAAVGQRYVSAVYFASAGLYVVSLFLPATDIGDIGPHEGGQANGLESEGGWLISCSAGPTGREGWSRGRPTPSSGSGWCACCCRASDWQRSWV